MNIFAGHAILICLIGLMQLYQTLAMIVERERPLVACMTLQALLKPARPERPCKNLLLNPDDNL